MRSGPVIRIIKNHVCVITRNGRIILHSRAYKRDIDAWRMAVVLKQYSGWRITL